MKGHQLYRTDVEKDLLWMAYLESFPPGSNPIYKERTEHDCQSCKSFIRAVGSMVAIVDGEMVSLWDCEVGHPYNKVAAVLSELVKGAPIRNVLLHDQADVGVDKNYQESSDGEVLTWEHFHVELPRECLSGVYSDKRSARDVFVRSLEEITIDALETVIDLVEQGSLYRGEEHLGAVQTFLKLRKEYAELDTDTARDIFSWRQDLSPAILRIRNSAIGTLLVDLSKDRELDAAVRSFESKVAPANYQRPKAIVTKAMVERARKTVDALGYTSALGRRFAVAEDVNVTDVLFANRDARRAMNADVFDEIISETRDSPKSLEKVEEVPIEKFIKDILPKATSLELLLENKHSGNLVNLIAPRDPTAQSLFKWPNNFSWAYQGDLTDSIKERVKAAGGNVSGDFRASLAWWNYDDLDLHLKGPGPRKRYHIFYGDKRHGSTGGQLDVDMNAGDGHTRTPVENITYPQRSRMHEGLYELLVHQFSKRENKDVGFEVELEFDGETHTFAYDQEVRQAQYVQVAQFTFTQKDGIKFIESLPRQSAAKTMWNLATQRFHPVTMVMLSPNHWGGRATGNKHWFFMLQDCRREGSSRGFFNEYLSDDLREHRKVFEILGAKMRTEDEGDQLSGLGFSSTQRNSVYCKVSGAFTRTINIVF
jgi:hypothetical protein